VAAVSALIPGKRGDGGMKSMHPPITWEVFPNTDADVGGWYSYVADQQHYLGGDWHRTKAEAIKHARKVAENAA
jgi:hypothetical protein